jgi:cephalosporin hydroxylase
MKQSSPDNPLYRRFLDWRAGAPPIHKWHHYFDVYHDAFAPWRGRPLTMLEIGVQNGGSLRMWQEYFGPAARIFGLDVDPSCAAHALPGGKVFIGDQADPAVMRQVLAEMGPPDIVLDDGGHTAAQQTVSFEILYPAMRVPGVYLVEDTHTAFWGGGFADHPEDKTIFDIAFGVCKRLQEWTRRHDRFQRFGEPPETRGARLAVSDICRTTLSVSFHDSMIVFRRGERPEPWHELR